MRDTHTARETARADSDCKSPVLLGSRPRPSLAAGDLNNTRSGNLKRRTRESPVFCRFGLKGKLICNMTDLELGVGGHLPNLHSLLNQV